MFDAFIQGFFLVLAWPAFGYMMLGVLIGIWLGAVPGLGGIIGLVMLLPFTFTMEPVPAFALLLGMYAVTTTSDTIASIMLGIPGTAASQATILDGYPLAQKGQAARAFGAAFTVSAFGGIFGALILAASLPLILPIILAFGSPELFMLGVLGLAMVGSLSGGSVLKGLVVACLGLLMSTIGYAETVSIPRYYFGTNYLIDDLPLIPVVLGLFALPELMELAIRNVSISRVSQDEADKSGILDGVKDAFTHWWLAIRCSIIGTYIGMLPGLGGAIVDWVAYGHAVQSAKDKSQFGQGDIRGVIAPEAANNATKGGSLVPTVAFGIPGGLGAAILLGALLMQGLKPGPEMLTTQLHVTFSMVWTIVIANIVVAVLLMFWSKQVAKVAFLPGHLIVPGVILFIFMGAWLGGASLGDWISVLLAGFVGFIMKRGGWPRPPLVLALILGSIMENAFQVSMQAYQGPQWMWERPIVLIIAALTVITVALALRGIIKSKKDENTPAVGEGSECNPVISVPFSILLLGTFIAAAIVAQQWPETVRNFPVAIAIPAGIMMLGVLFYDIRELKGSLVRDGGLGGALASASEKAVWPAAMQYFGYLIAMVLIMLVIGQKLALPVFIVAYLRRWGGYGWKVSLAYGFGGWVVLVGFYDKVMNLFWHPAWINGWLPDLLPSWLPSWLFV